MRQDEMDGAISENQVLDRCKVKITPESLVADWAGWSSRRLGRPLVAVHRDARPEQVFVENELLVDSDDKDTLAHLVEHHEAQIVPPPPVPPPPEGLDPDRMRSVEGMPTFTRVRFPGEQVALDGLDALAARQADRVLQVTSRAGAGTLALASQLALDGRQALPNLVGRSATLPLRASTEDPRDKESDAYRWREYSGQSRIAPAWQLLEAYAQLRSLHLPVYLGIFDAGFWLDANGRPLGYRPDVTNFFQWNLTDEGQPAGGANNEPARPWHGNTVLSAAAAPINNGTGAAGAGGLALGGQQIVIPFLFKTFRSIDEVLRGLQLCVAWGVDVVNISFTIAFYPLLFFPSSRWEQAFQFAADNGVVVVAAAGNEASELPETVLFPATRTPGVITVGSLDKDNKSVAADFSNYGSSVEIWAPGTDIHIMPDPENSMGSLRSGTSISAPIVAGVAAMMKSINPALKSADVKRILRETGYGAPPTSRVTVSLNAQAALLDVMGGRLPDGSIEEPNNNRDTARPLVPGPDEWLAPLGTTSLASRSDQDWYRFQVKEYSRLLVTLDYVPELSSLSLELVPDDVNSRALWEQDLSKTPDGLRLAVAQIAPGSYCLVVRGSGPNIYELRAQLLPNPLAPDRFETNNTLKNATWFTMEERARGGFTPSGRWLYRLGTYEASLHTAKDVDFYQLEEINPASLLIPLFTVSRTDAPLDAVLLREDGVEIGHVQGERAFQLVLPAPRCWVRISGSQATRYVFEVHYQLNKDKLPGPFQDQDVSPVPDWWPDPPLVMREWEKFLQVQITDELKRVGNLRLTSERRLTLDLLSSTGVTLASGVRSETAPDHGVEMDLGAVEPGTYIMRVGRDLDPAARLDPTQSKRIVHFNLSPGW
jgi:hypothetical protein